MSSNSAATQQVSKATLRYHRGSAQKARLVVDQIRGRNVNDALELLDHSPKAVARPIGKLLRSAVANAEHGEEKVDIDTLFVGEAYVGGGPMLKRFRGRAFGRAFQILHRTCHITLKLSAKAVATPAASPATADKAAPAGKGARKTASAAPSAKGTKAGGKKPAKKKPAARKPARKKSSRTS